MTVTTQNPTVRVRGLTKKFQGFTALDAVDIDFLPGRVHMLFGENGAGKSTLINLLAGVHRADAGTIEVDGVPCSIGSPHAARQVGISTVFQEPALVPQLTIEENLNIGREETLGWFLRRRAMRAKAAVALERVASLMDPGTHAGDLSRAEQQIVEIAKSVQDKARLVIFDEPTASLTEEETARLFETIQRLKSEGLAIIYITHRMSELRVIGDDISVLRDGKLVRTSRLDEVDDDQLVTLMTGRKVEALFPTIAHNPGVGGLLLEDVHGPGLHGVSMSVKPGEIVGLTGLVGSGKAAVGETIYGLTRHHRGRIMVNGRELTSRGPRGRVGDRIIHYPSDRKKAGLVPTRSARENASLSALDTYARGPVLKRGMEARAADRILERLALRPMRTTALPGTFSGGNQQKIVLARGFSRVYDLHIFDEPTTGVDVGARCEIYQAIADLVHAGAAVLVISSDLPEIVNLVHRAYVITEGRIVGEFTETDLTEENLLPWFFHHPAEATA